MRHVWFRKVVALIWLLAGVVTLCHGGIVLGIFDLVMGVYFGYHAILAAREEKKDD